MDQKFLYLVTWDRQNHVVVVQIVDVQPLVVDRSYRMVDQNLDQNHLDLKK